MAKRVVGPAERGRLGRLVERWRTSGRSAREFGEKHGLSVSALRYWERRLGKSPRPGRRERRGGFAAVRLTPDGPEARGLRLEIALASGDVIRVTGEVPIERIVEVVTLLRSGC
jgi:hypothetical protein